MLPAVAAILLLLAAGLQLVVPSSVDLPQRTASVPHQAPEAEPADPPTYAAIMAHPIFAPDRAPPPAEADASGNLNGVVVMGTAIAGKSTAAALVRDSGGTLSRIKVGETIEGWKLVSIEPKELVFDRNGERRSLTVDITRPAAKPMTDPNSPTPSSSSSDDDDDSTSSTTDDSDQ